jgi:tetratricopeptide (TPR) repeat protein
MALASMAALAGLLLARGPAPQPPPAGTADPVLAEAFLLFERDQIDAAGARFDEALAAAVARGDRTAEAEALRGTGRVRYRQGRYADARASLEQALVLFEARGDRLGVARVRSHLGSVAVAVGDRDRARALYLEAREEMRALGALRDETEAVFNLVHATEGAAAQRALVAEGLALASRLGDPRLEGKLLHLESDIDYEEGRFADAMRTLDRATRLFEQAGARPDLARALNSLSRLSRSHGDPERVLDLAARALAIQEELDDVPGMIQSLDHLADATSLLGDGPGAVSLAERAAALARGTGSPRLVSTTSLRLAAVYARAGEHARAVPLLEEALKAPADPERASSLQQQLALALSAVGRSEEAAAAAERAVALVQSPERPSRLLPALYVRALVRQRLGRKDEALDDAREQIRRLESLRQQLVPADFMKQGFADQNQAVFGLAIGLLHEQGRLAEAFELAEQARARAFLDLLASRDGALDRRWQAAAAWPESGVAAPAASVDQVVATVRRLGSTLLGYFVTAEATFVWVVGPSGEVRGARVAVPRRRLVALVRETRAAGEGAGRGPVTRGGGAIFLGAGGAAFRRLHELLLGPVLSSLPAGRLTILPHGPLHLLSFAALRDARGRTLVEDHALHYAPSAAVLELTGRRASRRAEAAAGPPVFVADPARFPDPPDGRPLPPLPATRREVKAAARALGPGEPVLLAGEEAREEEVRRHAPGAAIVHFATHGILRDDDPLESFLALSPVGSDDGRLTVREVYDLDLSARLVVLSACRTGLGRLSADGILGLTRAFFYAGAPSVVATLWDVADEPTARLVPDLYAHLGRGLSPAEALRAAQVGMLRDLRAGRVRVAGPGGSIALPEHPALWAGLVLLGEP